MIRFDRVSKRYPGGYEALKDVSFRVEAGEMVFLIGHSGAGKSTLLKLITLLETPSNGQVLVNNRNIAKIPRRRVPYFRRELGVVYQDNKLLFDRTVFDNVALPLVIAGFAEQELRRRVRAALDKVGLLGKEAMYPVTLSGGEQQRVGIARAVVHRPGILLADEPTGNLDAQLSDDIIDLFREFNRHGMTVMIATHEMRHVARLPMRVLELDHGRLVVRGDDPAMRA